jgi:acyl carrier protein
VVVLAEPDLTGEPVLTAYYTQQAGQPAPTVRLLRAHLAALLPASLIPARFVPCDSLPRLPNGKVDRRALAVVGAASAAISCFPMPAGVAPEGAPIGVPAAAPAGEGEGPVHRILQDIWQQLLKRDPVGLDEDFFLLGGHSLLATRLVARIRDRLGVELPLIRVFEAPTIRGLARFLAPEGIRMHRPDDPSIVQQADQ